MKKFKSILCIILALLMIASMFACAAKTDDGKTDDGAQTTDAATPDKTDDASEPDAPDAPTAAAKPESVKIGVTGYLGRFLDGVPPANSLSGCCGVYDQVWYLDVNTKEEYSYILSDWHYEDDCTLVMTLKDGVTFNNGHVATGDDLLFSVVCHIGNPEDTTGIWLGDINVEACKAEGNTVTLVWNEPWGPGLYGTQLLLMDSEYYQEVGIDSLDWYNSPNGSGPYKVTEYVNDDHFVLELKEDYWNKDVKFDIKKYTVTLYQDTATLYMALEKGDIDFCGGIGSQDYERWLSEGNDDVYIMRFATGDNCLTFPDTTHCEILKDENIRHALAIGVDWAALGQLTQGDRFVQPTSIFPEESPYYYNVGAYEYDPDAAKQIIADGGYTAEQLYIHLYMMTGYKDYAEAFQFYATQLGFTVDVEYGDTTSMLSIWMQEGTNDLGWFQTVFAAFDFEPHKSLNCFYFQGFQWAKCGDQTCVDLCMKALHTVDKEERIAAYKEVQIYCHDHYLIFPVATSTALVGFNPEMFSEAEMKEATYTSSYFNLLLLGLARE